LARIISHVGPMCSPISPAQSVIDSSSVPRGDGVPPPHRYRSRMEIPVPGVLGSRARPHGRLRERGNIADAFGPGLSRSIRRPSAADEPPHTGTRASSRPSRATSTFFSLLHAPPTDSCVSTHSPITVRDKTSACSASRVRLTSYHRPNPVAVPVRKMSGLAYLHGGPIWRVTSATTSGRAHHGHLRQVEDFPSSLPRLAGHLSDLGAQIGAHNAATFEGVGTGLERSPWRASRCPKRLQPKLDARI